MLQNNIRHQCVHHLFMTVKLGKEAALFNFQITFINKYINLRGLHELGNIYSLIIVIFPSDTPCRASSLFPSSTGNCLLLNRVFFLTQLIKAQKTVASAGHFFLVLKPKAPLMCQCTLASSHLL